MKTGQEWLNTLPGVIQNQWRANMIKQEEDAGINRYLSKSYKKLEWFLLESFLWDESNESWEYWEQIANGKIPIVIK